jgi:hypothetical protein
MWLASLNHDEVLEGSTALTNNSIPSCRRSADTCVAGLQPPGLGAPRVAFGLHHLDEAMQDAGVDRGRHQQVLREESSGRVYAREITASAEFVISAGFRPSAHGFGRPTTRVDSRGRRSVEVARCPPAAFRRFGFPRF